MKKLKINATYMNMSGIASPSTHRVSLAPSELGT